MIRQATHAGSWYDNRDKELSRELDTWLQAATPSCSPHCHPCAMIGPHAGLRYSGSVAAYAYKQLDLQRVRRIFLLGPSHHYHTRRCCLTRASVYSTPLGDIPVDRDMVEELDASKLFETMSLSVDEAEHSLELHLPFIRKLIRDAHADIHLVPIMVGAVDAAAEERYGTLLAPYLSDPENVFIISSDFCHWGDRFSYTPYDPKHGPIHASIEALDRRAMALIQAQDPDAFRAYLEETNNTICGRHPILVLLHAMRASGGKYKLDWRRYAQSSACQTVRDSSVSYAAAIVERGE